MSANSLGNKEEKCKIMSPHSEQSVINPMNLLSNKDIRRRRQKRQTINVRPNKIYAPQSVLSL